MGGNVYIYFNVFNSWQGMGCHAWNAGDFVRLWFLRREFVLAPSHAAGEAYTPTGEGLAALRAEAKSHYEKGDKRQLLKLSGVLDPMGKDKRLDISCRLAATGIAREVKGYIGGLDARDADARKIAESCVRIAAISVKRDLAHCE
jgi:hypothetical protein